MNKLIFLLLITLGIDAHAQYNKEKLLDILAGAEHKTWQVTGINIERPEKKITFRKDYSGEIEDQSGKKKGIKWSLQTRDNIRWFIDVGGTKYELIVSYNKKGEQYVKLTHREGDDYEMKLNQIK